MSIIPYKVGDRDKQGRKIVQVSPEGWYRDQHGAVRDADGYEWFGHSVGEGERTVDPTRVMADSISGQTIVIRDFKIAMLPGQIDPKEFIKKYRPVIEQTMVETGWDYADEGKQPNITFGKGDDGYAHIYVRMKKKVWRNRDNAYSGAKQGQSGKVKSEALTRAGALDPHIYGTVETDRQGQDILVDRK